MKPNEVMAVAFLVSLAIVFEASHGFLGIPRSVTGFMYVDLVGVPIVLAFFLFGFPHALYVGVLTALAITLVSPDSWLGAGMKFASTLPMVIVPATYALYRHEGINAKTFAVILVVGVAYSLSAFVFSGAVNLASQAWVSVSDPLLLGVLPIIALALFAIALHFLWGRAEGKMKAGDFQSPRIFLELLVASLVVRGVVMIAANYYYAGPLFFGQTTEQLMASLPAANILFWNSVQGVIDAGVAWAVVFPLGFGKKYGKG